MLKTIRNVFITLVILTLLISGGLYLYSLNRTYYNDEEETGNTAGNIYNGGLFCEKDGKVYFSNDKDDGSLYVMKPDCTNFKLLSKDKAVYINVDENYIYYVRANNTRQNNGAGFLIFYNTGVYRIRQNGSDLKVFTGNPGAYLSLKGNSVYFQRYDVNDGLYLFQYKIDTTEEHLLIKDSVIPAAVMGNNLYYAGFSNDHNINAIDLSSYTGHPVISGSFLYPIFMGDYIYYLDGSDDYKLYRMNQDGSEPTLLVDKRCAAYNITNSGKYLYYQIDDTKNNGISRLNLDTMEEASLLTGNYKQINITNNYVFFKDFDNTNTYVVAADGPADVNIFDPSK